MIWNRRPSAARLLAGLAALPVLAPVVGFTAPVWADPYDAPADYYTTIDGLTTGTAIKNQLHLIISDDYWVDTNNGASAFTPDGSGHHILTYTQAAAAMWYVDEDPADPSSIVIGGGVGSQFNNGSIILAYSGDSVSANWNNATIWNREHRWPASWALGVDTTLANNPDYTDIHMLAPANPSVNSQRSNYQYVGGSLSGNFGVFNSVDGTGWFAGTNLDPGTGQGNDIGDSARALMYMAVRYDGGDPNTVDLELVEGSGRNTDSTGGDLSSVLEWHYRDAPDNFERKRNSRIFNNTYDADTNFFNPEAGTEDVSYLNYQGNRNPFVDNPELAHAIFVDDANDTQISIDGATVNADGSSSLTADLGSIIVGGPAPAGGPTNVTLNKTGNDGTYYSVTATGGVTATLDGKFNAFEIGGPGSQALTVDFAGAIDPNTPGFYGGTVTIDNLDVTTGAGLGQGAQDGDDVISVGFSVLDHSEGSFDALADQDVLNLDFGVVPLIPGSASLGFDIYNVQALSGFTAGLDLDAIGESGDAEFSTDLALFSGLAGGSSNGFQAMLDTSATGVYSKTITLSVSDEDITGAVAGSDLTLNLTGSVTFAGDANLDFVVDLLDFDVLAQNFGQVGGAVWGDADFNGDGNVDLLDFDVLAQNFGAGSPAAVPEPASLALLGLGGVAAMRRRRVAGA
ncbi:MAG: endonuclease [Planctomycetota bacterium]